ncbi:HEAT repeat domain-containing protein [Rhodobacter maris]|uniref:HEAT repeat protein n=1 Tax=Rhodobacter maris TaxID=446682 RepID=A0A285TG09_9RHOB|nr:HEAT repeat domain-containing protein [Rhodobacter maris]SOC21069.1 HEAT repeat protein [Rhodobacter maris]
MPLIAPKSNRAPRASRAPKSPLDDLRAPDPGSRRTAARALLGTTAARGALEAALRLETDPAVRQALLSALVSVADDTVVELFAEMLRSEEASHRSEAVSALQQLPETAAQVIVGLLHAEDADLRIMAVDVIRLLPHADAPVWLRDLLSKETHPNVVGVAVDRLAEIGGADDLPALQAVRSRFADDPYLAFATDLVIERIVTLAREASG